jgi:hypothetical protein
MKPILVTVVLLALRLLLVGAQDAPLARFSASTLQPLTGEQFELTLMVDVPPGITLAGWPELPSEWGPFEIIAAGEPVVDTRTDGMQVFSQVFTVRVWRPGDAETPETLITYAPSPGLTLRVPVRVERLTVPTVLDFNDLTLRPLRPTIDLFYVPLELVIALGGVIALAGYAGVRAYRRRTAVVQPLPEPSPRERLESALDAGVLLEPAERLALIADALREYTAGEFGAAADQTTDELLDALAGRLPQNALVWLQQVLGRADAVKFSGEAVAADDVDFVHETLPVWLAQVAPVDAQTGQG